jgi:hypothetical protein
MGCMRVQTQNEVNYLGFRISVLKDTVRRLKSLELRLPWKPEAKAPGEQCEVRRGAEGPQGADPEGATG